MAFEAFLDPNSQLPMSLILPGNGDGAILEALSSHNSQRKEEHMDSILSMAQLNTNLASNVMNSAILKNSLISRSAFGHDAPTAVTTSTPPTGAYLQSLGNSNLEAYMSFLRSNPVNVSRGDNIFSHLYQNGRRQQQLEDTKGSRDPCKKKLQTFRDLPSFSIKMEPGILAPSSKRPRLDVNQENAQQKQKEIIDKLLLKELQNNSQRAAMIEQYGLQNQLQKPILLSSPQLRGFNLQQQMRSPLQQQDNLQMTYAPLLDGAICSRRLKQYLYHLRNNAHDNGIAYWKKFVCEYYAPGSKKRWCFCSYEHIEMHPTGVFSSKSTETWCCDICGSRLGKGFEATFNIFSRLFKTKFESGMVDEILFLDSPRSCTVAYGLVLEYGKAIQESVYENFRVVHEGKLRIVFRHDLKILSWEFCIENHEEFLLRRLVTPQVNEMVQAAAKIYQNSSQNGVSFRASSEDLQTVCDMFVSASDQLARNMETPLVNDIGYPKRFIRCLQIAEVVDSMKDIMALSLETKMGPKDCLSIYSQGSETGNLMKDNQRMELFSDAHNLSAFSDQIGLGYNANVRLTTENGVMPVSGNSGSTFVNFNHQFVGQNSSFASMRQKGQELCLMDHSNRAMSFARSLDSYPQNEARSYSSPPSQSSGHSKNPHQALVDKMLHEMVPANRGKSVENNNTYGKRGREGAHPSNRKWVIGNDFCYGKSSNAASHGNLTAANNRNVSVKVEPSSPGKLPEDSESLGLGLVKIEDLEW